MTEARDQKFDVAGIGNIFHRTLTLFAHHLEDEESRTISLDQVAVGQRFFVFFKSGTGLTRTSAERIV